MQPTYMYGSLPSAKLCALKLRQKDKIMIYLRASLVAQLVKNLPAMRETSVRFLGWEDHMEKEKSTHSSILAWRIPWAI